MTQSPQKSDKQKRKQKRHKQKAFQSFLTKNESTPGLDLVSNNQSDTQQKTEQTQQNGCIVCSLQLGQKKKNCGFCNMPACGQHMRKKRKNKQAQNKFVRICDNCQDKYLFNKYMKLQLKNQQSMTAQQSIIQAKKDQIQGQAKGRKTKLKMLYHHQNEILGQKKENQSRVNQQQNQINSKLQKIDRKLRQLDDLQKQLKELQQRLPPSFEDDYHALQLENNKVNKQLLKHEKLCHQAIKAKSKRQKQIYDQYNQWQQTQRQKITKKQDDCNIF